MGGNHVGDMVCIYVCGWTCAGLYETSKRVSLVLVRDGCGRVCLDLCGSLGWFCMAF